MKLDCHESLRSIAVGWNGLQAQFRQQYSRIGNIKEQLFHAWRLFYFDENSKTTDNYVTHKKWEAALLGYGEPQGLEVLKRNLYQNYNEFSFL